MSLAEIKKEGTTLNVWPEGRIDTARTPALSRELQPCMDGIERVVMDFSKVEYISSSGLRLLLWLEQMLEDRGGGVQVTHVSDPVMKIMLLAGFDNVVEIVPDGEG